MRIIYQVTDDDIRNDVKKAVNECEDENWIEFPDGETRAEFIDELTETVIEWYESDYAPFRSREDLETDVLDLAKVYGFTTNDQ